MTDEQLIERVAADVKKQIDEDQAAMIAERKEQYGDRFQSWQETAIEELHRRYRIGVEKMAAALSTLPSTQADDEVREALVETHNERAELLHLLQVVRPYVSDRAGTGIISALDAALAKVKPNE